jgi:nitroimidazol reductase NimA-like FMN-containing flavoprotein (pyridoxamine 5'-phosphate oxidase superfamily)
VSTLKTTDRSQVKRPPRCGDYSYETLYGILDEGMVCHVGFTVGGKPFVIPTSYGRADDTICIHGFAASRMLRNLAAGVDICVTVTIRDGVVLAQSARSAMIFGTAHEIEDPTEKKESLRAITERLVPGRWKDVRQTDRSGVERNNCLQTLDRRGIQQGKNWTSRGRR